MCTAYSRTHWIWYDKNLYGEAVLTSVRCSSFWTVCLCKSSLHVLCKALNEIMRSVPLTIKIRTIHIYHSLHQPFGRNMEPISRSLWSLVDVYLQQRYRTVTMCANQRWCLGAYRWARCTRTRNARSCTFDVRVQACSSVSKLTETIQTAYDKKRYLPMRFCISCTVVRLYAR